MSICIKDQIQNMNLVIGCTVGCTYCYARNNVKRWHMKNGTMFTDLDKYKKQEFFDEHPVALLITPDKNYKVVFFAGYVAAPQDDAWEIGFTEAEFEVWLQNAADRSCFTSEIAPNNSDHILTLSTCSYEFDDARFVLAGVLR